MFRLRIGLLIGIAGQREKDLFPQIQGGLPILDAVGCVDKESSYS